MHCGQHYRAAAALQGTTSPECRYLLALCLMKLPGKLNDAAEALMPGRDPSHVGCCAKSPVLLPYTPPKEHPGSCIIMFKLQHLGVAGSTAALLNSLSDFVSSAGATRGCRILSARPHRAAAGPAAGGGWLLLRGAGAGPAAVAGLRGAVRTRWAEPGCGQLFTCPPNQMDTWMSPRAYNLCCADCGKAEQWLQCGKESAASGAAAAAPATPGGFPGFNTGFPPSAQQATPTRDLFGSAKPPSSRYGPPASGSTPFGGVPFNGFQSGGAAAFGQATPYAQQQTPQLGQGGRGSMAFGAADTSAVLLQPPQIQQVCVSPAAFPLIFRIAFEEDACAVSACSKSFI